jgi:hypothetical protein
VLLVCGELLRLRAVASPSIGCVHSYGGGHLCIRCTPGGTPIRWSRNAITSITASPVLDACPVYSLPCAFAPEPRCPLGGLSVPTLYRGFVATFRLPVRRAKRSRRTTFRRWVLASPPRSVALSGQCDRPFLADMGDSTYCVFVSGPIAMFIRHRCVFVSGERGCLHACVVKSLG